MRPNLTILGRHPACPVGSQEHVCLVDALLALCEEMPVTLRNAVVMLREDRQMLVAIAVVSDDQCLDKACSDVIREAGFKPTELLTLALYYQDHLKVLG